MIEIFKNFLKKFENKISFTFSYLFFGLIYIYFSETILLYLDLTDVKYQIFKGFFYVIFTGWLLYYLISKQELHFDKKLSEINKQKDTLENIFKSFDDIVWSVSIDFKKFYFLNDSCEIVYGYRKEEFLLNPNLALEIVYEEDKELVNYNLNKLLIEGTSNIVHRAVNKQNQIIWVRIKAWLVYDKNNIPERIDGITINITNEKNKELKLLQNNNNYYSIYKDNPNPILLLDSENLNLVSYNNKFYEAFLGVKYNLPEHIDLNFNQINLNVKEIFSNSSKLMVIENLLNINNNEHSNKETKSDIFELIDVNNKIVRYKINFKLLKNNQFINVQIENSKLILLTLFNIEEELNQINLLTKKLDNFTDNFDVELKKQTNNLILLNKEKDDLISMAVHDMKNPLSSILLQTSLIKKYSEKGEITKIEDKIIDIEITISKITELISNLLNINRLESGNFKFYPLNVNVEDLILDELKRFNINIESKNIKVNKKIIQNINANIDPYILAHIFNNIFSNALKYSNINSEIDIELFQVGNNFAFVVKDYGQGISKSELSLIYNKFSKLSSVPTAGENSTGLGLSIVKKYIDLLGGEIICDSIIGEGTQFKVIIPINNINNNFN